MEVAHPRQVHVGDVQPHHSGQVRQHHQEEGHVPGTVGLALEEGDLLEDGDVTVLLLSRLVRSAELKFDLGFFLVIIDVIQLFLAGVESFVSLK